MNIPIDPYQMMMMPQDALVANDPNYMNTENMTYEVNLSINYSILD